MRATPSVVFGLVSLVCSANATRAVSKPVLAKRQDSVTVTINGCTGTCDFYETWVDCTAECPQTETLTTSTSTRTSTLTSTHTSTRTSARTPIVITTVTSKPKAPSNEPSVVSSTSGACHNTCSINEAEGDFDCYFTCDVGLPATMSPPSVSDALLHQRTVASTADGNCTATCWDLMPGAECDLQCKGDAETRMLAPGKAAPNAHREVREDVQAHQVQEERLARNLSDLAARDESRKTKYITLISVGMPPVLPVQVPLTAEAVTGPNLKSEASAMISKLQQRTQKFSQSKLTPIDQSVIDNAFSFMSAEAAASVSPRSAAVTTTSTYLETITALAVTSTTTTTTSTTSETTTTSAEEPESGTTTATLLEITIESSTPSETPSETVTKSTTTTASSHASKTTLTQAYVTTGGAHQYTVSTGLVLFVCLLVGLAVNVLLLS